MDLIAGQKARREMQVTSQVVSAYAEVTGDYNLLHFDPAFAGRTRFKGLIVQGGITTDLLHVLVAMDMPGPGTVFISQTWSFPKPVATIDFVVTNQNQEEVLLGEATVYQALPTRPS